jgi:hypothetical protein
VAPDDCKGDDATTPARGVWQVLRREGSRRVWRDPDDRLGDTSIEPIAGAAERFPTHAIERLEGARAMSSSRSRPRPSVALAESA